MVASLLAVAPAAVAQPVEGRSAGADAFFASAGLWHAYFFDHGGGDALVVLSWSSGLVGADHDLTLFRPGALDDGYLGQDEVVERSWAYGSAVREERIGLDLAPGRYVVSVEPIRAQGESYVLDAGGRLQFAAFVPGVKLYV